MSTAPSSALFAEYARILTDPLSGAAIDVQGDEFVATSGRRITLVDGIPNLFAPTYVSPDVAFDDVTEMVKAFYEETPFPNYDGLDSRDGLVEKARGSVFAALLDAQIPANALVLEAGCGTGQLSNFLGMSWARKVFGGDICLNSLRLAKDFADRQAIHNVAFVQMNLFRPPFRDNVFDVVISNGVLHHTGNCRIALASIVAKLKPGGHIVVGLYNRYARLPTLMRRWTFAKFGARLHFLDRRLRHGNARSPRVRAWFMDQYRHPHETRHSMDEVLQWFDHCGLDFVNGVPHPDGSPFESQESLFDAHPPGSQAARLATQLQMLATGGKDGGLFIMIGRKRR